MVNMLVVVVLVLPACGDDVIDIPPDAALPVCPVLGCTVPQCTDLGCFCNGMACVPTGIPVPSEVRQ